MALSTSRAFASPSSDSRCHCQKIWSFLLSKWLCLLCVYVWREGQYCSCRNHFKLSFLLLKTFFSKHTHMHTLRSDFSLPVFLFNSFSPPTSHFPTLTIFFCFVTLEFNWSSMEIQNIDVELSFGAWQGHQWSHNLREWLQIPRQSSIAKSSSRNDYGPMVLFSNPWLTVDKSSLLQYQGKQQ